MSTTNQAPAELRDSETIVRIPKARAFFGPQTGGHEIALAAASNSVLLIESLIFFASFALFAPLR